MKKLRLDIDQVRVDTFQTEEEDAPVGTVLGREDLASRSVVCGSCPVWSCPSPCP
jgi:hypothetical protein